MAEDNGGRELWIDWNLRVAGPSGEDLRGQLTDLVGRHYDGKRFHYRKHSFAVGGLLANLLRCDGDWLRYQRNRNAYYGISAPRGISLGAVARTIECFTEHGLLTNRLGYYDRARGCGAVSLLQASESLHELLGDCALHEVEIADDVELLVCRDFPKNRTATREHPEANRMRCELREYNNLLAASAVQCRGRRPLLGQYVCRVFNRSWNLGGRFYRGSWQNMPGKERRKLSIDGNEVVELDYGELHLRMLYADEQIDLEGDAYAIDGVERKVMKITALVALNAESHVSARDCLQYEMNKGRLPKTHKPAELLEIFARAHPRLGKYLGRGVGLSLQNRDSELVRRVLQDMTELGVLALPVHDSLIVPEQHEGALLASMRAAYVDCLGVEPKIAVKRRATDEELASGATP